MRSIPRSKQYSVGPSSLLRLHRFGGVAPQASLSQRSAWRAKTPAPRTLNTPGASSISGLRWHLTGSQDGRVREKLWVRHGPRRIIALHTQELLLMCHPCRFARGVEPQSCKEVGGAQPQLVGSSSPWGKLRHAEQTCPALRRRGRRCRRRPAGAPKTCGGCSHRLGLDSLKRGGHLVQMRHGKTGRGRRGVHVGPQILGRGAQRLLLERSALDAAVRFERRTSATAAHAVHARSEGGRNGTHAKLRDARGEYRW